MAKVLVLLASHAGAEFLGAQLWSIRHQSFMDWRLLIRNDGHDAETERIVREHMRDDPRVSWIDDGLGRLGVCGNFEHLLGLAQTEKADYFALSDQDDIWLENKLEAQLKLVRALECEYGAVPVAVHSDLTVVDADLGELHRSFVRLRKLTPDPTVVELLARNVVTGCTLLGNARLLAMALPFPAELPIHDWWLALCARAGGRLGYLDRATVLYRQHASNAVGAKLSLPRVRAIMNRNRLAFEAGFIQAKALLERITPDASDHEWISRYSVLPTLPRMERWREMGRLGVRRDHLAGRAIYALRLLALPRLR